MATVAKRIGQIERSIKKASGSKRTRLEQKLAFLQSLPLDAKFKAGPKQRNEGGWRR